MTLLLLLLALSPAAAGQPDEASGPTDAPDAGQTSWDVRISAAVYLLPSQDDFVQPTVAVDHGVLHLEGRYNYEAQHTASLWVGWNFEWGESLRLALTPMLGGVFGDENGVALGLEWTLSWGPLEFYSEAEFVFDLEDSSESNFYTWSELTVRPLAWLRLGVALQRTRALSSPRELQWGPLLGASVWKLVASAYWFNPGQTSQYWVLSVGVNF